MRKRTRMINNDDDDNSAVALILSWIPPPEIRSERLEGKDVG
jgi:hypothetical protein